MLKYLTNTAASLRGRHPRSYWPTIAPTGVLIVAAVCCMGLAAALPWAAPRCPPVPMKAKAAHGVNLSISGPYRAALLGPVNFRVTVTNHGKRVLSLSEGDPIWLQFPGTWCWGPGTFRPTRFLREVGGGYRLPHALFASIEESVPPGGRCVLGLLDFSHIFDLSVPGKYEAQLAGMGMVSNLIKFRVLPPKNRPDGPAIDFFSSKTPKQAAWGNAWHGVQIAAYVESNPGIADPIARVRILFRCAGKHAATMSLTGNPSIDFARRNVIGPFHTIKVIDGKPAPLTAYGKLLVSRHNQPPPAKRYMLKPGVVYTYWRPLVLNREFDLSVYGPYEFSTRLHGAELKTAPVTIYVGVQSRFYKHLKIPR